MQIIFLENMDLELSKDVPGMFKSFLERILSFFQIWWKSEKSGLLAIFEKMTELQKIINYDLGVVKTFWDRFLKDYGPLFPFLILFSYFDAFL